jgi:hypothetical protein
MTEFNRLLNRGKIIFQQQGPLAAVKSGLDKAAVLLLAPVYQAMRGHKSFQIGKKNLKYFIHSYNATWRNERTVEIPLAWDFIALRKPGDRVLEIGNVMANYDKFGHTVVDKYEKSPGVINEDIITYAPKAKFDLAFSISTFEHIGWDEQPRQPEKVEAAIKRVREFLAPGGKAMITFPTGYNNYLDGLLAAGTHGFDDHFFLRRVSADNRWAMSSWEEVKAMRFDGQFPAANSLFVGYIGCTRP